jgi:hypothetical protein
MSHEIFDLLGSIGQLVDGLSNVLSTDYSVFYRGHGGGLIANIPHLPIPPVQAPQPPSSQGFKKP